MEEIPAHTGEQVLYKNETLQTIAMCGIGQAQEIFIGRSQIFVLLGNITRQTDGTDIPFFFLLFRILPHRKEAACFRWRPSATVLSVGYQVFVTALSISKNEKVTLNQNLVARYKHRQASSCNKSTGIILIKICLILIINARTHFPTWRIPCSLVIGVKEHKPAAVPFPLSAMFLCEFHGLNFNFILHVDAKK